MKHLDDTNHCDGCQSFHKCLMTSQLRVLLGLHQGVGILLVSAGLAQGVDRNGNPLGTRKIVPAAAGVPIQRPLTPV